MCKPADQSSVLEARRKSAIEVFAPMGPWVGLGGRLGLYQPRDPLSERLMTIGAERKPTGRDA